eukprot:scaffold6036_cov110-Isochrysis_galbana.AAC.4
MEPPHSIASAAATICAPYRKQRAMPSNALVSHSTDTPRADTRSWQSPVDRTRTWSSCEASHSASRSSASGGSSGPARSMPCQSCSRVRASGVSAVLTSTVLERVMGKGSMRSGAVERRSATKPVGDTDSPWRDTGTVERPSPARSRTTVIRPRPHGVLHMNKINIGTRHTA